MLYLFFYQNSPLARLLKYNTLINALVVYYTFNQISLHNFLKVFLSALHYNPHSDTSDFFWGQHCSWTLTTASRSPTCSLSTIRGSNQAKGKELMS